jgi:hypothetical protein
VYVGKRVILGIPTTKTNIKAANTRAMVIDNDNLLVMGPKLDIVYQINALARLIRTHAPLDPIWSGWRMQAMLGWRASRAF